MGNKFEDEVCKFLNEKFNGNIVNIVNDPRTDINHESFQLTFEKMKEGVPIITQAMLYNYENKTFGVADILVRSDWINYIFNNNVLDHQEEIYKAPYLEGDYHYRVIDIKWTTVELCANGKLIRNNQRFPAYKGQLAIYNAALGILQGYTPNKAYIMAKSWKYSAERVNYTGYNCFDLLGEIDYENFDKDYLEKTADAVHWVRNVRYNGREWTCVPPSVPELYPNMCNRYDNPYHKVKKEIASKIQELTEIWMIGTKNRNIAHDKGIFKWSDENCNSKNIGINGKKVAPIVDKIIDINRTIDGPLIKPDVISNNYNDWQTKKDIEFFIDFEGLNSIFYNRDMDIEDSKQNENIIFLIGVGYEENGKWNYIPFFMRGMNKTEEERAIQEFVDFIEFKVEEHMAKYNIQNRNLCFPTFYHWGHAEITMFNNINRKFNNKWKRWQNSILWIDFCKIFQTEPIVVKNAKKFNLKEIARAFKSHGLINTVWDESGIDCGLSAMIDATDFYRQLNENNGLLTEEMNKVFTEIIEYNEIDCKTVWEIVEYLRNNHIEKI